MQGTGMRVRISYIPSLSLTYIWKKFSYHRWSKHILSVIVVMISYASTVFLLVRLFSLCSCLAFPEERREICYYDDTLLSFEFWINDALPYCSSLLSISDSTVFSGPTESSTYIKRTLETASNTDEPQNHQLYSQND